MKMKELLKIVIDLIQSKYRGCEVEIVRDSEFYDEIVFRNCYIKESTLFYSKTIHNVSLTKERFRGRIRIPSYEIVPPIGVSTNCDSVPNISKTDPVYRSFVFETDKSLYDFKEFKYRYGITFFSGVAPEFSEEKFIKKLMNTLEKGI